MAGYTAAMRIERIEIRGGVAARPTGADRGAGEPAANVAVIELAGAEPGDHFRQRVADLRIYIGQLTWYLFNAESWR